MKNIRFCNQPSNKFSGKHFRPNNFPLSRIFSQKRLFHIFEDIFVGTKFSYQSYDFDSQFDSYRVDIWQDHIFFFAQDENNSEKKNMKEEKEEKNVFPWKCIKTQFSIFRLEMAIFWAVFWFSCGCFDLGFTEQELPNSCQGWVKSVSRPGSRVQIRYLWVVAIYRIYRPL